MTSGTATPQGDDRPLSRRSAIEAATSIVGAALVAAALVIIWAARFAYGDPGGAGVYVSELGATGSPTAHEFEVALLLIVAGGALIGFGGRDIRSRIRWLAIWTPAVSLWASSGFFLVASQVTCTYGCPLPAGDPFDWQDFTHIVAAVLAFAFACMAMLQAAFAHEHRGLARFSLATSIAVGVTSGIGGILSLAKTATEFGANAELGATSIAVVWVVSYGLINAGWRLSSGRGATERADISSSRRLANPTST